MSTFSQSYLTQFVNWFRSDGRHFQIVSQVGFLLYGVLALGWNSDSLNYACAFAGCVVVQWMAIHFEGYPRHSIKSALITSLGISLLLRANSPWLFLAAAILAIGQKFLLRVNGKHLWNPTNFGIVIVMLVSGQAWISPGQWGNAAVLAFIIGTAGLAVLSNIRRLDTGIVFIVTIAILEYSRVVLYLGWGMDVWLHKMCSGSIWLFAFFMITDPMTTPNARVTRIIWSIAVAAISFYIGSFKFINAAPFWVLFFATPFTPFIDKLVAGRSFTWIHSRSNAARQS